MAALTLFPALAWRGLGMGIPKLCSDDCGMRRSGEHGAGHAERPMVGFLKVRKAWLHCQPNKWMVTLHSLRR